MISLIVAFCFHFGPLVRLTVWLRHRIAEVDDFISKLWQVHLAVKKEGYTQVHVSALCISPSIVC